MTYGQLHHIEYYVRDLSATVEFWGWFLPLFDYAEYQKWSGGISWRHSTGTYIVFVQLAEHAMHINNDRQGTGLNHIAFVGKDEAHLSEVLAQLTRRRVTILTSRSDYLCFEDSNHFAAEIFLRAQIPPA